MHRFTVIPLLASGCACCALSVSTFAADAKRPNIVLIFADDLGWKDVGYNGSDFYETPNIDRLAKAGMVFCFRVAPRDTRRTGVATGLVEEIRGESPRRSAQERSLRRVHLRSGRRSGAVVAKNQGSRARGKHARHLHKRQRRPQTSSQEPLRGSKGGYYEGGIRESFIARWPGVVRPGAESHVPIINVDFYPTFLAIAGVRAPAGKTLDGENLLPLFKAQGSPKREAIFWHFPGHLDNPVIRGRDSDVRLGFRTRPVSVIRKGDWKLHLFHEEWQLDGGRAKLDASNAVELYNLRDDPGEHQDLAARNKAKRDELLVDLLAWFRQTNALLPTEKNAAYAPDAAAPKATGKRGKQKGAADKVTK